jgi:hypothetical protein
MYSTEDDYEAYLKEQAYLDAERESLYRDLCLEETYMHKVLRYYYTPDKLPVYILCQGVTSNGDLRGIVFKSYEPAFTIGEEVILSHYSVSLVDIDVSEVKNNTEILF